MSGGEQQPIPQSPIPRLEAEDASLMSKIHSRIQAKTYAIEQLDPTEILKERAKALSCEIEKETAQELMLNVVEFVLANEHYAIEAIYVREVCPLIELTSVPCTPPFILGIVCVRGQILAVIDIKKFFDLPQKGITDLNKIIIVETEEMTLGILADIVLGSDSIPLSTIQPSLPTLTGIRAEYLRGVTSERIVVLNIQKILADKKIIVHEQVDN